MAALAKAVHIARSVNNLTKLLTNLPASSSIARNPGLASQQRIISQRCAFVHTTPRRNDLMEFFDNEKFWGQNEVKTGRAWKKDELRIKSNEDLHKLWFVLLKERNMLLTMEEASIKEYKLFPTPERKDKVEESMANLEHVVRERNKAFHLLETGETGERPGKLVYNALGLRYFYRMSEHKIPKFMNTGWKKRYTFTYGGYAVRKFLRLYREKIWNEKRKARNRDRNHVMQLIKRFPNLDLEAVKEKYPDVDVDATKRHKLARGHYVPQ